MATEINEFQAKQQSQKSILNRIEMAKRGIPVAGGLPSGWTFNRKTEQRGIDKEFQKKIEHAADMFLKGTSLKSTAAMLNMTLSNLRAILLERCGDTTMLTFNVPRFKIHETISIPIPRLLPQDKIDAVKVKLQTNKMARHGHIKNQCLLSRAILCGHCGRALHGETRGAHQYYVHKKTDCQQFRRVSAAFIEDAVMVHLFTVLGNRSAMEKAIQSAIPDYSEIEQLLAQQVKVEQELKKIKRAKNRLLDLAEKDVILESDIKERMVGHRERECLLTAEMAGIKSKMERIPSENQIKYNAQIMQATIESI